MSHYEKGLEVLSELFSRDCIFALATNQDHIPSVREVDTYYTDGALWIVTYGLSKKVKDIVSNPNVALCHGLYSFTGKAYNMGHPLDKDNKDIREKLIKAFDSWYFKHNNEQDENMCYVKVELTSGFFYKEGLGYKVDFINQITEVFPFEPDIAVLE